MKSGHHVRHNGDSLGRKTLCVGPGIHPRQRKGRRLNHLPTPIRAIWDLLQFDPIGRAEHDYRHVFLKSLTDLRRLCSCPLDQARLLILGCGYTYPEVVLYTPRVSFVAGLDVMGAFYRDGILATFRDLRARGGHPALALLKALIYRYKFARYYRHLARLANLPIHHEAYTLLTYDGYTMPFPDDHFDVVMSNAVLEHVSDMERLAKEVFRVTKPTGISYHLWHNYYSLSGGHVGPEIYTRYPWGHLRGLYETRGVNRLLPEDIVNAFAQYFTILALYPVDAKHAKQGVDEDFAYEGENLLTPELRQELAAYPESLLLTRAYLIVARKGS